MAWEFDMVAGPFNPRLTEGPAWDGETLLFTHIPASRIMRYDVVSWCSAPEVVGALPAGTAAGSGIKVCL